MVLAQTERGEVQAARFGPTVWGVQLHPEVDEHILAEWAAEDPDRYAEGVLEDVLAQIADARDELESGWRPLAQALAALPEARPMGKQEDSPRRVSPAGTGV